jgi:tRNA (guanine-N7-)-methyltransferase
MIASPSDSGDRDVPPDDGGAAHGHGSFFGRRKGHKLRIHQADLIDNLLPHLALDIGAPAPARLAELFEGDIEDIRLEIGFGGGEHLIAEAQAFPNIGFIGCEPYVNGMAKILTQIEAHNIGNIRLYAGDAAELLAWAPERSLARIDLIHPDPWPKRRHWKRRFVQDATINAMARILKAGCEFRFVSDIDDYCAWTLAHLMRSTDFLWTAERAADWRQPWDGYTMTRYGRKAEREGRVAAYLRFPADAEEIALPSPGECRAANSPAAASSPSNRRKRMRSAAHRSCWRRRHATARCQTASRCRPSSSR